MKKTTSCIALLVVLAAALAYPAWLLATTPTGALWNHVFIGDYTYDADPAILKALHGGVFTMYSTEFVPLMMPLALLIRVPAVGLGHLLGAVGLDDSVDAINARHLWGALWVWGLSAVLLGVAVMRTKLGERALPLVAAAAVIVAWLVNPLMGAAVRWGHVEEVGMAALMALAFLLLADERIRLSAVAAAAALAFKQPAVLILPVLFLTVPKGKRRSFSAWYAGAAVLFILPFIAANLGDLFAQTQQVTGAFQASKFHYNIFDALGLGEAWKSQSRAWIFAVAIAIPALYARRSGWQLTLASGAAIAVAVMLLRCFLDPYNIVYYAAPAAALALVWELLAARNGTHPFSRYQLFQKVPVPVLSLAAAGAYTALTHGFAAELIDSLAGGERSPFIVYALFVGLLLTFALTWAREPFAWFTKRRLRLYGVLAASVFAVLSALVIVERPSHIEASVEPPPGFEAATPAEIAEQIRPQRAWWLGSEGPGGTPLRLSAIGHLDPHPERPIAMFDYGSAEGFDGITINTTKRDQWKRSIYRCTGKCGRHSREIETRFGPGLAVRTFAEVSGQVLPHEEVWIKNGDHVLFIMVTDTERYPLDEVLENLRPLE